MLSPSQSNRMRGYTLIEISTALAVFAVIMLAITQILAQGMVSYRTTKRAQANLEAAQFSLNLMAKELRTSSVVNNPTTDGTLSTTPIKFYDYSQARCIEYILNDDTGQITRRATGITPAATNPSPEDYRNGCLSYTFSGSSAVIFSGLLDHAIRYESSAPPPDPKVGRITFVLTVGSGSGSATLQTTISFRDYNYTGL